MEVKTSVRISRKESEASEEAVGSTAEGSEEATVAVSDGASKKAVGSMANNEVSWKVAISEADSPSWSLNDELFKSSEDIFGSMAELSCEEPAVSVSDGAASSLNK